MATSRRPRMLLAALVGATLSLSFGGCGYGSSNDFGSDASLSVRGGRFFRGTMPKEGIGPEVESLHLVRTSIVAGYSGRTFSGVLGKEAVAAAIALKDDIGYWVIDALPPAPENPSAPTFNTALTFAQSVPVGEQRIMVWAIDAFNRTGPSVSQSLTVLKSEPVEGALVFRLLWDTDVDLDLSVTTPDGINVSWQNPSVAITVPGESGTPEAGGSIDRDSNQNCVADGAQKENISFVGAVPPGHYRSYVTVASMCDSMVVRYQVEAYTAGKLVATTAGNEDTSGEGLIADAGERTLALDVVMR
jgi:hypothetical protein